MEEISQDLESLKFDFATIEAATNNFSDENMIGKGGFGAVYKVKNYCFFMMIESQELVFCNFPLFYFKISSEMPRLYNFYG